jgi:hypothetical protein
MHRRQLFVRAAAILIRHRGCEHEMRRCDKTSSLV